MKKGRGNASPLSEYRRLMREIREIYDPFTAKNCDACETPCCRRPSRLTPLDVSLATACGHTFAHMDADTAHAIAVAHAGRRLSPLPMAPDDEDGPCEMLASNRCSFPDDLRPFGCTAYICDPMFERMEEADLRRLKRLVRLLSQAHERLMRAIDR